MELRLKGFGIIEITNATQVEGGDILIEAADGFEKLAETTKFPITNVYLTQVDDIWGVVACLDIAEDLWYEDDFIAYLVENSDDIYKLNACL